MLSARELESIMSDDVLSSVATIRAVRHMGRGDGVTRIFDFPGIAAWTQDENWGVGVHYLGADGTTPPTVSYDPAVSFDAGTGSGRVVWHGPGVVFGNTHASASNTFLHLPPATVRTWESRLRASVAMTVILRVTGAVLIAELTASLTTDWQRFTLGGSHAMGGSRWVGICLAQPSSAGTVWIDGARAIWGDGTEPPIVVMVDGVANVAGGYLPGGGTGGGDRWEFATAPPVGSLLTAMYGHARTVQGVMTDSYELIDMPGRTSVSSSQPVIWVAASDAVDVRAGDRVDVGTTAYRIIDIQRQASGLVCLVLTGWGA